MSTPLNKKNANTSSPGRGKQDELYHVNGVAYMDADLKINELRAVIAMVAHLQGAIRHRMGRYSRSGAVPEALLPPKSTLPDYPGVRVLTIPVSQFCMSRHNTGRIRMYLDGLKRTEVSFPDSVKEDKSGKVVKHTFAGIIEGYSFPDYSSSVDIYIQEQMLHRLLLIEEGYSRYSERLAMSSSSKYTLRLYWLLCSWRNRGGFVMTADNLRHLLSLGKGYVKMSNIVARVLEPSKRELEENFPIWFNYRVYEKDGVSSIAFKVKVRMSQDELEKMRAETYAFTQNLLASTGIREEAILKILPGVDPEDAKSFADHLAEVCVYVRNHREVKDKTAYVCQSMENWMSDWRVRYLEVGL